MKNKRYRVERTFMNHPELDNRQFLKNMSLEYCQAILKTFEETAKSKNIFPLYKDEMMVRFGKDHSIFGPVTLEIIQIKS